MLPDESRLSKSLSEHNQRNVILLVLAVLFSMPFFNATNYITEPSIYTYELQLLSKMPMNTTEFNSTFNYIIDHS